MSEYDDIEVESSGEEWSDDDEGIYVEPLSLEDDDDRRSTTD